MPIKFCFGYDNSQITKSTDIFDYIFHIGICNDVHQQHACCYVLKVL